MAAPLNVNQTATMDYYLNRLNGYAKNTVRIKPQTKDSYNSGDTLVYRLPTNAIIDLHTLALRTSVSTSSSAGTVTCPRFMQQFIRRLDVTAGGVQVGLGSLGDYGSLAGLLLHNTVNADKLRELGKYEGGDLVTTGSSDGITQYGGLCAQTATANTTYTGGVTGAKFITSWLGLLGGQFMRYLDTNLLPDVEIRITLASPYVLTVSSGVAGTPAAAVQTVTSPNFNWANNSLTFEVISFGDDGYRQMVDSRLASGEPIVVPFINWASYESFAAGGSASQTQFTGGVADLFCVFHSHNKMITVEVFYKGVSHAMLLDDDQQVFASSHSFCLNKPGGYAYFTSSGVNSSVHRVLCGLQKGDKRQVDHVNGNTLDNRKCNLLVCTPRYNSSKRTYSRRNGDGLPLGVRIDRRGKTIRYSSYYSNKYLGRYSTIEDASTAYETHKASIQ